MGSETRLIWVSIWCSFNISLNHLFITQCHQSQLHTSLMNCAKVQYTITATGRRLSLSLLWKPATFHALHIFLFSIPLTRAPGSLTNRGLQRQGWELGMGGGGRRPRPQSQELETDAAFWVSCTGQSHRDTRVEGRCLMSLSLLFWGRLTQPRAAGN